MHSSFRRVLKATFLFTLVASLAPAVTRDKEAFERKLTTELQAQRPEAVSIWNNANEARERGEHEKAARLYATVARIAPAFTAARRRQAGEELALGNRGKAISLGRTALEGEVSPENLAALAMSLSQSDGKQKATASDLKEAVSLASQAAGMAPDDDWVHQVLCQTALRADDLPALGRGVERLLVLAPQDAATHEFATFHAGLQGRFGDARSALDRARSHGMPEERYAALAGLIDEAQGPVGRWLPRLGWALGFWIAIPLVLLVTGALLSRSVLAKAETLSRNARSRFATTSPALRRVYTLVLWVSCAYYYVSLPVVALLVLGLGGGLVYGMLAAGRIPVKLLAIVVILTLLTLWSILKGFFVRGRDDDPGLRLRLQSEPRLRQLLSDVARKIGTRAVDNVYLTPGTELAVMERGGIARQLRGATERCLILGVGILDGMKIGPFKAILAHEYGHFTNEDTAGGGFALAVRRSLFKTAEGLAESGTAAWYNPAWIFLLGFHRVFLVISHGASRLQEILADRWAAFTYGSQAFEDGLRHVIERSVRFDAHASLTIQEMAGSRGAVSNLYTHSPAGSIPENEVGQAIRASLSRPSSIYDTHPSPMERTRWVRALGAKGSPSAEDEEEAWALFASRESIERQMTEVVQRAVS